MIKDENMFKDGSLHTYQLSEAHTYSVGLEKRIPWLVFFWGGLLLHQIVSLVTAIHNQDMRQLWINIAIILLFLLCGSLTWRVNVKQKLLVGREGIIYTAGAYTLYTPWDNIHKVVVSPHDGAPALQLQRLAESLPLGQGISEQRVAIEYRSQRKLPQLITSRYDLHNYIPLTAKKDDLWQDIQQHVPALEMAIPGH
jgi:hypothetical protein